MNLLLPATCCQRQPVVVGYNETLIPCSCCCCSLRWKINAHEVASRFTGWLPACLTGWHNRSTWSTGILLLPVRQLINLSRHVSPSPPWPHPHLPVAICDFPRTPAFELTAHSLPSLCAEGNKFCAYYVNFRYAPKMIAPSDESLQLKFKSNTRAAASSLI